MEEDKVKACPLERTMPSDPNMSQQPSFGSFPRSVMRRLGPLGVVSNQFAPWPSRSDRPEAQKNYAFLDIHWITASLLLYPSRNSWNPWTLSINII